jgi:hypothetical protein
MENNIEEEEDSEASEMARYWRGLCPAVDCGRLMMMFPGQNKRIAPLSFGYGSWNVRPKD